MENAKLVVFDFDKTLIRGDISKILVVFLCFKNPKLWWYFALRWMRLISHCDFNSKLFVEYSKLRHPNLIYKLLLVYARLTLNSRVVFKLKKYSQSPEFVIRIISSTINPVIEKLSQDLFSVIGYGSSLKDGIFFCLRENKSSFILHKEDFQSLTFFHFYSDSLQECQDLDFFCEVFHVKNRRSTRFIRP